MMASPGAVPQYTKPSTALQMGRTALGATKGLFKGVLKSAGHALQIPAKLITLQPKKAIKHAYYAVEAPIRGTFMEAKKGYDRNRFDTLKSQFYRAREQKDHIQSNYLAKKLDSYSLYRKMNKYQVVNMGVPTVSQVFREMRSSSINPKSSFGNLGPPPVPPKGNNLQFASMPPIFHNPQFQPAFHNPQFQPAFQNQQFQPAFHNPIMGL